MGKLDELRRTAAGNIDESMGAGRSPAPIHGGYAPGPRALAPRLQGITRPQNAAVIPVDKIGPDPDQPREEFDQEALNRLAESLRTRGQISPIMVRWDESRAQYVIICGERRWRAAGLAGLPTMQCVISEGPVSPGELLALQVIENCVREDLRPVEQAKAFRALMDREGLSGNQLAKTLGIAQSSVVRSLSLLDLPPAVQERVERGALPASVAYEVSRAGDIEAQTELAARAVAEGLNRAEVVEAVRRTTRPASKGRGAKGKAKRTSATIKATAGYKVIVENRRGVDDDGIIAALTEALDQARARREGRGSEAA
jgi:ParB family chromosome partitioning protein